jgi:chromosome segregation ATPase
LGFEIATKSIPALQWFIDVMDKAAEGAEQLGVMLSMEGRLPELKAEMENAAAVVDEYNELIRNGASHHAAYAEAVQGITPEMRAANEATRLAAQAAALYAENTGAAEAATRSLADEVRKATDPAFALRKEQEAYEEAQERVSTLQKAGQTTTQDYRDAVADLLEQQADLNHATEQYESAGMKAEEGLFALAEQAKVAREEVELLIFALENAGNTPVSIDVQTNLGDLFSGRDFARDVERELGILDRGRRIPQGPQ